MTYRYNFTVSRLYGPSRRISAITTIAASFVGIVACDKADLDGEISPNEAYSNDISAGYSSEVEFEPRTVIVGYEYDDVPVSEDLISNDANGVPFYQGNPGTLASRSGTQQLIADAVVVSDQVQVTLKFYSSEEKLLTELAVTNDIAYMQKYEAEAVATASKYPESQDEFTQKQFNDIQAIIKSKYPSVATPDGPIAPAPGDRVTSYVYRTAPRWICRTIP